MGITKAELRDRNVRINYEEPPTKSPSSPTSTASQSPQMPATPDPKTETGGQRESSMDKTAVTEAQKTAFSDHISSDIVTFLVGPKRRTFKIHHSLICSASGYFKTMLRRSLSGRPITEKYLPNHDAEAFSLFVTYLYRGSFSDIILTSPKAGEDRVICTDQTHEFNVDKLVKLCFIAMDWDIPALYNYVVDYLIRYVSKHWKRLPLVTIAAIAANTKDDSDPLRRLAIDQVVFIMQPTSEPRRQKEYIDRMIQIVSLEFLGAVLKGVVEPWTPADPLKAPPCTYHRHKEGERCP
ncbi:MAG: hypothetical protein LQ352_006630 [Teloschistes flavicans]|nr:MAG: hypothetical protein LQ352_006630 [Teloschistes flavicans]